MNHSKTTNESPIEEPDRIQTATAPGQMAIQALRLGVAIVPQWEVDSLILGATVGLPGALLAPVRIRVPEAMANGLELARISTMLLYRGFSID